MSDQDRHRPPQTMHIVGRWQDAISCLLGRAPRGLCGEKLTAEPGSGVSCPACIALSAELRGDVEANSARQPAADAEVLHYVSWWQSVRGALTGRAPRGLCGESLEMGEASTLDCSACTARCRTSAGTVGAGMPPASSRR